MDEASSTEIVNEGPTRSDVAVAPLGTPIVPERTNAQLGAVLVHGFTGSPYQMRDLAAVLDRQGYRVAAPRLSGHATSVHDLASTTLEDWQRSVHDAVEEMRAHVRSIVLLGRSFGGVLALREVLDDSRGIAAVVLLATPAPTLADAVRRQLLPFARLTRSSVRKPWAKPEEAAARRLQGRYTEIPLRALAHYYRGLSSMQRATLRRIVVPVLLVQGDAEDAIPRSSVSRYAAMLPNATSFLVPHAGHDAARLHRDAQRRIVDFLRDARTARAH